MEQGNKTLVWLMCFVTAIIGVYWSVMALIQQIHPLWITFLVINVVALVVIFVCFVIDIRKNKKRK